MNRETYPAALFPLRGDLNAEAGATTVEVIGLQTIPFSPEVNPEIDQSVPTYVAATNTIQWLLPIFNENNTDIVSLVPGDVLVWNGFEWVNALFPVAPFDDWFF